MKISESDLRKLVREELDAQNAPTLSTTLPSGGAPERSGVRSADSQPHVGALDLSSLVDDTMGLGQKTAELLKRSLGLSAEGPIWDDMEVHHRVSNAVMTALRSEVTKISRELEMEDE